MNINGIGYTPGIQKLSAPVQRQVNGPENKLPLTDRLELSGASQFMPALKANGIRADKVAEIKAQLADESYDPDGSKLDAAMDKMLDDLEQEMFG